MPRKLIHGIKGASCAILLIAAAMCSSGCTAIFAVVGAAVDTVCVTSPLWGPAVIEKSKLDNIQSQVSLRDDKQSADPAAFSRQTTQTLTLSQCPIHVRFFEGKSNRSHSPYFSWLSAAPLVPYANVDCDVKKAKDDGLQGSFCFSTSKLDAPKKASKKFVAELPESKNSCESGNQLECIREHNRHLLAMASATPGREELESAYLQSQKGNPAFQLTLLARETLASQMPERKVDLDAPVFDGAYSFGSYSIYQKSSLFSSSSCGDSGEDNFLSSSQCGGGTTVHGQAQGYRPDGAPHIRITGKLNSLAMEKSQICYGLTLVGADILSLFGAPLSTDRLAAQFDVAAYQMPEGKLLLDKSYTLETTRRVVGVYYGGDFAADLNEELCLQARESIKEFARELAPKFHDPRKTAQKEAPSALLRRSL